MSYRTFLAFPLGEIFEAEVADFLSRLRSKVQGIRWVLPSQLHITVHFFGPTTREEIERIKSVVGPVAATYPPLNLRLEEAGCFPNPHRPRVIWIGVSGDADCLIHLQQSIDQGLSTAGFAVESRIFRPHATLGRVKKEGPRIQIGWDDWKFQPTEIKIMDRIVLFQSILSTEGARYEALETFYLTARPYPEAA